METLGLILAWILAALATLSVLLAVAVRFRMVKVDLQPGTLLSLAAVGLLAALFVLDAFVK